MVIATEPDPFKFAVNVNDPVTNTAVAARFPDTVVDTVSLSEFKDPVKLIHLENELPVAVIDIESPEATGIRVPDGGVYTAPFIVTSTEPVPSMVVISDRPPVTNTAVAVILPDTVADTVLLSECIDGVSLTHLENVLPVPVAFMNIVSPEATGITVLASTV